MAKYFKNYKRKVGLPPGSLTYIGPERKTLVRMTLFVYNQKSFVEKEINSLDEIDFDENDVVWLNVDGIHDTKLAEAIGKRFNLHLLTVEDIVNTEQRPKVELNDNYVYLVLKMLNQNVQDNTVDVEQVSFVLGKNFVISFQEKTGDTFTSVRNRIRLFQGKIRKYGADYLLYALVDTVVDHYYLILEKIGDNLDEIEDSLLTTASEENLRFLYRLKKEMVSLRRAIWPLREVVNKMDREETSLIKDSTRVYLRDVYDHIIQVIDTVENYRDMLASMLDLYLSTLSNRINSVMKVLTIIATIFIPLTFIVGIYGMNFRVMPELNWEYGYFAVWIIMILIAGLMVAYFKRKNWM